MPQKKQHWIVTFGKICGFVFLAIWAALCLLLLVTHQLSWKLASGLVLVIYPVYAMLRELMRDDEPGDSS